MVAKRSSDRLKVVLKLAQIRQQQAAEKLADATRALETHRQQGQQLRSYQDEYNKHFHSYEQATKSPQQMRNYQRFYGDLEEAVYTQDQRSEVSAQQLEYHRNQWQKTYGREKNMQSLVDRKRSEEEKTLEDKLQRELDDRANSYLQSKKSF